MGSGMEEVGWYINRELIVNYLISEIFSRANFDFSDFRMFECWDEGRHGGYAECVYPVNHGACSIAR